MVNAQVRKSYEEKRRRRKARGQKRPWRLKRMAMELEDDSTTSAGGPRGREHRGGTGGSRHEQDMERFMQVG
jgi:nonsense-mediated mRNA decay protein 3